MVGQAEYKEYGRTVEKSIYNNIILYFFIHEKMETVDCGGDQHELCSGTLIIIPLFTEEMNPKVCRRWG